MKTKAPPIVEMLVQLASQLHMLAQTDASLETHYHDRQMKRRKLPPRNPDEFHRACAITVVAAVARCEAAAVDVVDAQVRRDVVAALAGIRRILGDVATCTPRNPCPTDARASWHCEFVRAAKHEGDLLKLADLCSVDEGHAVSIFQPMLPCELTDYIGSESTRIRWAKAAEVRDRKQQGDRYTKSEVRRILEYGAKHGKGAAKAAAAKILEGEAI